MASKKAFINPNAQGVEKVWRESLPLLTPFRHRTARWTGIALTEPRRGKILSIRSDDYVQEAYEVVNPHWLVPITIGMRAGVTSPYTNDSVRAKTSIVGIITKIDIRPDAIIFVTIEHDDKTTSEHMAHRIVYYEKNIWI